MKKICKIFLILWLGFIPLVFCSEEFGYISYSSYNIGDDIQSLAAKRFLPEGSIPIDREFLGSFQHDCPVSTIINGWLMHTKKNAWYLNFIAPPEKSWPPPSSISPLLISLHFTKGFLPEAFAPEAVDYMKAYGPVGARDLFTLQELQKRDIPSYLSGCLTLTLDNPFTERDNIIYIVDLDKAITNYVRKNTNAKVIEMTHKIPLSIQFDHKNRLKYAENLLNKYRKAKCVLTSRFHATMPCLAFETPVILVNKLDYRFKGLKGLVNHCSPRDILRGKYDLQHPPQNPQGYRILRENMIEIVTHWVNSSLAPE